MLDRLVEITIVKHDTAGSVGLSDGKVVVEDKFEGGVADEVTFHLDAPVDGGVDDVSWTVE